MTSEIAEKGLLDSIAIKEGKGRPTIVKDEHTVFIFELRANLFMERLYVELSIGHSPESS